MLVGLLHSITLVAAAVLALAGAHKVRDPRAVTVALRAQGLPATAGIGRVVGTLEIVVGIAALSGAPVALGVLAAVYGAFTVFVARAARDARPCGCLDDHDAPASWFQVGFDAVAAGAAVATAFVDPIDAPATTRVAHAVVLVLAVVGVRQLLGPLPVLLRLTHAGRS